MRESPTPFCPVPTEQQPVNEYEQLRESWFFGWAALEGANYWRNFLWSLVGSWLLVSPIAAASFAPQKLPLPFLLSSGLGAGLAVFLLWLRLYLGWHYIGDRLQAEQVCYEESGWYDGQIWQKPTAVLSRDRLIASYQVRPILKRLQQTAFILFLFLGSDGFLLWLLL